MIIFNKQLQGIAVMFSVGRLKYFHNFAVLGGFGSNKTTTILKRVHLLMFLSNISHTTLR